MKTAIDFFKEGLKKHQNRDYRGAIQSFNRAVELNRSYNEAYFHRACAYFNLAQYHEAVADYTEAIHLGFKHKEIYKNRANAYYNVGQYVEAIADYTKAIRLGLKHKEIYENRGNAYYNVGQYDEAVADYSNAIDLGLKNKGIYANRANAYYNLSKYHEAIADYSETICLDRDYTSAYFNRANSYFRLGAYREAMIDYDAVIRKDPKNQEAYFKRGRTYFNLAAQAEKHEAESQYGLAEKNYREALRLGPNAELKRQVEAALRDVSEALRNLSSAPVPSILYRASHKTGNLQKEELPDEVVSSSSLKLKQFQQALLMARDQVSAAEKEPNVNLKRDSYEAAIPYYREAIGCLKNNEPQKQRVQTELADIITRSVTCFSSCSTSRQVSASSNKRPRQEEAAVSSPPRKRQNTQEAEKTSSKPSNCSDSLFAQQLQEACEASRPSLSTLRYANPEKVAQDCGVDFVSVPGDGNCFYHAIAAAMQRDLGKTYTHELLRARAVQYFETHPELHHGFGEQGDLGDLPTYLDRMRQPGIDAEGPVIQAMFLSLNVRAVILEARGEHISILHENENAPQARHICIVRTDAPGRPPHYDACPKRIQFEDHALSVAKSVSVEKTRGQVLLKSSELDAAHAILRKINLFMNESGSHSEGKLEIKFNTSWYIIPLTEEQYEILKACEVFSGWELNESFSLSVKR